MLPSMSNDAKVVLLVLSAVGTAISIVAAVVAIAWTDMQARRLDKEVRDRTELERKAREYIDLRAGSHPTAFGKVPLEKREAVALAEKWGAVEVQWDKGEMMARLRFPVD
jgi:hypothetical protein